MPSSCNSTPDGAEGASGRVTDLSRMSVPEGGVTADAGYVGAIDATFS
jgi:hypothetical protein